MTSWTQLVQLGGCDWSKFITLDQLGNDLIVTCHLLLAKSIDINSIRDALTHLQVFVLWFNEVVDALIVYLNIADFYLELSATLLPDHIIDLSNRKGDQALFPTTCLVALHGVSLTRAGLAVYKDCLVDAI